MFLVITKTFLVLVIDLVICWSKFHPSNSSCIGKEISRIFDGAHRFDQPN